MLLTERRVSLREKPETTCAQVLSLLQPGRVGHHGYDDAHWCRTSRYVALVHFWCSGSMVRGPVSPPSQDSTPEMVVRLASHPTACRLPAPRAIRRPPGTAAQAWCPSPVARALRLLRRQEPRAQPSETRPAVRQPDGAFNPIIQPFRASLAPYRRMVSLQALGKGS